MLLSLTLWFDLKMTELLKVQIQPLEEIKKWSIKTEIVHLHKMEKTKIKVVIIRLLMGILSKLKQIN